MVGWHQDGILREAIDEDDEELFAPVGRKRANDVDRQGVPGTLRLDGASCLGLMAIISAKLSLMTAPSFLETDAPPCLMLIPVTKQLPKGVTS